MRRHFSWAPSSSRAPKLRRSQRDLTTASPFHVFIDEAQNFKSGVIGSMYGQIRKFKLSLFLVTQDFSSLDDKTRAAITANADTIICFRLSPDDAEDMARLFNREHQQFNPVALQNLNVGEAYFHGGRLVRRSRHVHIPRDGKIRASKAAVTTAADETRSSPSSHKHCSRS